MRSLQGIKPQDILLLFKLRLWRDRAWRHVDLAAELGVSQTEVSFALERCRMSGFLDAKKQVLVPALLEFLEHGLKYVYPVRPGAVCLGMRTAHSASGADERYVWPWAGGTARGQGIEPLYESAPFAAAKDPRLHELLALADVLRVGQPPERAAAMEELAARVRPNERVERALSNPELWVDPFDEKSY